MKYEIDEDIAWSSCKAADLWLFDKLLLSKFLGYRCGPVGVDVPKPDDYIVRPCVNILGMGRGAKKIWISKSTDNLPEGYFWCEVFKGRHFSIDYINGKQTLAVEGFREPSNPLWKWGMWRKVNVSINYPLTKIYPVLNAEFIEDKLIEVHFRLNPDFEGHQSDFVIPVWEGEHSSLTGDSHEFIQREEYKRKGFLIEKTGDSL